MRPSSVLMPACPSAQAPPPHDSKSGWARQQQKSREDYSRHNPTRVMRPMHWSKYLQPKLPSSKRSRASHSSRLRRYVRKVQRSVRVLVEIRKSSFGSCFSGVVFCLLRMFPLNGRKLRVEVVPWRSRRMPGSWMWTWCGGQLFAQAPQPAQLLSSKEERASQCDRASGVALLEQVALLLLLLSFCCCLLLAAAAAAVCAAARRDPAVVEARPLTAHHHRLTARLQSLRLSDQLRQLGALWGLTSCSEWGQVCDLPTCCCFITARRESSNRDAKALDVTEWHKWGETEDLNQLRLVEETWELIWLGTWRRMWPPALRRIYVSQVKIFSPHVFNVHLPGLHQSDRYIGRRYGLGFVFRT